MLLEIQQKLRRKILYSICPDLVWSITYLSTPTMTSWWCQWVVMAVPHCYSWWRAIVWQFVSDSHKVMTAVIVMLPSGCCEDFCTISWIQWLLGILLVEGFWVMVYVWHPVFVLVGDLFQITSGFMLEFDITQGYLCCRKYFKNGSEHSSTFGSFVPLKRQGSIGRRNLTIFKTKVFFKTVFFLPLSHLWKLKWT